jgi:hypothetical protein
VNARLASGPQLQGGFNIGQSARNECDVVSQIPESLTVFGFRTPEQFCDIASGWKVSVGGLASYVVPRLDVLVSGTLQSRPFSGANFPGIASQSLAANWLVFNAQVQAALGRPLAGGLQSTFVNVVEPGTLYGDRITQVDMKVSKILRFGGRRANIGVDFFNLFNTNAVYQYATTYVGNGATWLQPSSLVTARFAKLSVQFDF